jgi:hypothetical protein
MKVLSLLKIIETVGIHISRRLKKRSVTLKEGLDAGLLGNGDGRNDSPLVHLPQSVLSFTKSIYRKKVIAWSCEFDEEYQKVGQPSDKRKCRTGIEHSEGECSLPAEAPDMRTCPYGTVQPKVQDVFILSEGICRTQHREMEKHNRRFEGQWIRTSRVPGRRGFAEKGLARDSELRKR